MEKRLVIVTWWDAKDHPDTWVDEADAEKFNDEPVEVRSVGWLIRQTDRYVTLGSDSCPVDKDFGAVRKIPIGMVKGIIDVGEKEPA